MKHTFYRTEFHIDVTHVCTHIHFMVTLFFKTQELWSFLQTWVCSDTIQLQKVFLICPGKLPGSDI